MPEIASGFCGSCILEGDGQKTETLNLETKLVSIENIKKSLDGRCGLRPWLAGGSSSSSTCLTGSPVRRSQSGMRAGQGTRSPFPLVQPSRHLEMHSA